MADLDEISSMLDKTTLNQESSDGNSTMPATATLKQNGVDEELARHLRYLERFPEEDDLKEAALSPVFTSAVRKYAQNLRETDEQELDPVFPQHALLGCESGTTTDTEDNRLFYNVAAPCSIFVCGSQGSGKSHTLSCVLESCLIPSEVSQLRRPLTGLVFHYDTFTSEGGGAPCEAAHLASNKEVSVRVLCAPTNLRVIQETYKHIPRAKVEPLQINQADLNTQRMLDLMAVGDGTIPLYMHVIQRILRDMRISQQQGETIFPFNYAEFKEKICNEPLTPAQLAPLTQRLETLESFMVQKRAGKVWKKHRKGTDWTPTPGQLTIVDLSCPCVTAAMACSLFNICLSIFLEKRQVKGTEGAPPIGKIVALDEAHKYMNADESGSAGTLTNSLLATIRLQRHLGLRIVVSTQEPTVSPKLLDLCSITVVHRFTSPDWMKTLRGHLAGGEDYQTQATKKEAQGAVERHFDNIVKLRVGEALLFAPSAAVGIEVDEVTVNGNGPSSAGAGMSVKRLGHNVMRIRVRNRITTDGGRTIMAT